jgi:hypothetical protein
VRDHKLSDRGAFSISPDHNIQVSDRAHGGCGLTEWLAAGHQRRGQNQHRPLGKRLGMFPVKEIVGEIEMGE